MTFEADSLLISELMQISGVTFGTSGARGQVSQMTDRVCYAYTLGFLQYLRSINDLPINDTTNAIVGIAGDLRPSSPRIMRACAQAVQDFGLRPVCCGYIPTPALAAWGISRKIPTLMITGSHIPDNRNGIKFYKASGEILKSDETSIIQQQVSLPATIFDTNGDFIADNQEEFCSEIERGAAILYVHRYVDFFPKNILGGLRVGVYEHSSVARDILGAVLTQLGAVVTSLGRSNQFIPVDTEAVRPEDRTLARKWATSGNYDCIVSTDGDGDRPLIADEQGEWMRGDIVGILTARYLNAKAVVTPVSCNTALEHSGWFTHIWRTRIGSPFVITDMMQAQTANLHPVVGYEANGGFLIGSQLRYAQHVLDALPTRDAIIVILSVLMLARQRHCPLSHLARDLPQRFTASDRLQEFPTAISQARINALQADPILRRTEFLAQFGSEVHLDTTDGLRMTFANGDIVHLRPSGNAPELRAYTEASSQSRAEALNQQCLTLISNWLN